MVDLEKERQAFEEWYTKLNNFPDFVADSVFAADSDDYRKYHNHHTEESFFIWKSLKAEINKLSNEKFHAELVCEAAIEEVNRLKAKLAKLESGEYVIVPKECPDPIFADKLFDLLCKKAHGEFGDDQMIFFSDIDESAIWKTMIEVAQGDGDE